MYKVINLIDIIEAFKKTLVESEEPAKRRDALLALTFYAKSSTLYWHDDDNDNDDDDDGNQLKFKEFFGLIKNLLTHDPDPGVRMYAAWVIGYLGNRDTSTQILFHGLNDEDSRVRIEAVQSLGLLDTCNSTGTVPGLIQALADRDVAVRMRALCFLLHGDIMEIIAQIEDLIYENDCNSPELNE